ncbi:alkaline phosphatase family protein [Calycomorphotria hydatis]|uniref:Type I phosphodiesterase / nucleotide pyrophosphatase n=1 Tax=Calycomorphotria hydatis TaxID=2528027 RepID=A0A517T7T9_9PLAN|nr:nucleotide pyrophosphatase/phosphodiesterase family protein [Calycomorphotria hydatis]QDT64441.1 Type I phosphodiesterase / nucleotide pyrophosphatase [Calycomorphotria hydatis]
MNNHLVLLSIPGLRDKDLAHMPTLQGLASSGTTRPVAASFPCVTCPVQISLTTGTPPAEHGVIANGFFWRDSGDVEMWTAWNEVIEQPRFWDRLKEHDPSFTSALWFPMISKGASADYICTPAPIHNPDGTESLWCYTKPTELYGELRDTLGHFPLMKFWGPLSSIDSSAWIVDSALVAAEKYKPNLFTIYLPHLDYAAQKFGPDSEQAIQALIDLDGQLEKLKTGMKAALGEGVQWLAFSEYAITPVTGAEYPNRILRDANYLSFELREDKEYLNPGDSAAWALVDHQFAHVFVKESGDVDAVAQLLRESGIAERVLVGEERAEVGLDHPRAGEIVLISAPDRWFAYYWWHDDLRAPDFARTVDIHRKPGYDPVEMFIDLPTKSTPLDASLVKGSHGYPADVPERQGVLVASDAKLLSSVQKETVQDTDIAGIVCSAFGAK